MSNRGFTLLELIIVMTLAALVLSLAGLRFADNAPSARLMETSRKIVSSMRQMKALASANGQDERFVIDLDSKRYGVEGRNAGSIPAEISVAAEDPYAGRIRNGTYSILFSAEGGVGGGSLILSRGRRSVNIRTDPILGALVERQ